MARRWSRRDKLTLRLPPKFIALEPGDEVETDFFPMRWQVQRSTIDGMVVVIELAPVWRAPASLAADPGRFLPPSDLIVGELAMALVELPDLTGHASMNPTVYLAASSPTPSWKRLPVQVGNDQFLLGISTARRKAVMGAAETLLADGAVGAIDTVNSIEAQLIDPEHWLTSCDDDALAGGANLALIGDELIQFADVEPLAAGRFRLTRLLRGRYATQWATSTHAIGDLFLLIDPSSLQPISLPPSARGAVVTASCQAADAQVTTTCLVDGRSLRTGVFIGGKQVVGSRVSPIPAPSGGANIDPEVRSAVSQILAALRQHGLIES